MKTYAALVCIAARNCLIDSLAIARVEEMQRLQDSLKQEIPIAAEPTRTLLEQAENLSEENKEILRELVYLRAKVLALMERDEYETAYLRNEMQQLAMALLQDSSPYGFGQNNHPLPMLPMGGENHEVTDQLPFDFDLEQKKPPPKFIEKAAIAAAARAKNPTFQTPHPSIVDSSTSLTERLESLLKKSAK